MKTPQGAPAAPELTEAARALLRRLDHVTTDGFAHGAERNEREALRQALAAALGVDPEHVYTPPTAAEAEYLAGDPRPKAEQMEDARLAAARVPMARALAEIAVMCGFVFNVTARDVKAAELASKALDLAGITDPAGWLKAHEGGG